MLLFFYKLIFNYFVAYSTIVILYMNLSYDLTTEKYFHSLEAVEFLGFKSKSAY